MSRGEKKDMFSEPPPLIRTLSTQHWLVAESEMAQKQQKIIWAGSATNYEYQVVRDTASDYAIEQTLFDGKVVGEKYVKITN